MSEKIYVPGVWAKQRTNSPFFQLTLNCKAADLVKFIHEHTDERGWIKFGISEMKQPKEKQSHSVWLDTWRPDASRQFNNARQAATGSKFADVPSPKAPDDDSVPF